MPHTTARPRFEEAKGYDQSSWAIGRGHQPPECRARNDQAYGARAP